MMKGLWLEECRPKTLDEISFHREQASVLKKMAHSDGLPHLLFYGPKGSGKKTLIDAILKEVYGPGAEKVRAVQTSLEVSGGKSIDVTFLSSNYHIEIYPSEAGIYDRQVVQNLIKTTAQTKQIDFNARKKYKIVVVQGADSMSLTAQAALRRTMEKYATNLRLILSCRSYSRVIHPIRSRCYQVRVSSPTKEQISEALNAAYVYGAPHNATLPRAFIEHLSNTTDRNYRKALLTLQTAHTNSSVSIEKVSDLTPEWEKLVSQISSLILSEQSSNQILKCREIFYKLLSHCVSSEAILELLLSLLLLNVDNVLKPALVRAAASCDHMLRLGSRDIIHLETFVTKVMCSYNEYLTQE